MVGVSFAWVWVCFCVNFVADAGEPIKSREALTRPEVLPLFLLLESDPKPFHPFVVSNHTSLPSTSQACCLAVISLQHHDPHRLSSSSCLEVIPERGEPPWPTMSSAKPATGATGRNLAAVGGQATGRASAASSSRPSAGTARRCGSSGAIRSRICCSRKRGTRLRVRVGSPHRRPPNLPAAAIPCRSVDGQSLSRILYHTKRVGALYSNRFAPLLGLSLPSLSPGCPVLNCLDGLGRRLTWLAESKIQ